jgi:hypothetical protein
MAHITHERQVLFAICLVFVAPHFGFSENKNPFLLGFLQKNLRFCSPTVEDEFDIHLN